MCVISAVVLFRTWGFAGIANLLSSLRRHQHILPGPVNKETVTGLTHPVPDAKGWPSSCGG